jgi:diguanylate cyclase (GGDEF)-like protein/PAS domain S-box-containing protein
MKRHPSLYCCYVRLSGLAVKAAVRTGRALTALAMNLLSFEEHSNDSSTPGRWYRSRRSDISPQLAASVFNYVREGIIVADCSGHIVRVNEAFTRITGYEHDDVVGQNLSQESVLLRKVAAFCASVKDTLIDQGHWSGEVWSSRKDGCELALKLSVTVVRASNGQVQRYIALLSDITQLKKHQQRLERRADYDALTQLPNRDLLARQMRQAVDSARAHQRILAVAFIDLDGFKGVNDRYGHGFGDSVLKILAQRIKATIREHDTLARLGGDEFVAGLVDLQQPRDCKPVLRRMLQAACVPIFLDGITVQVSASIGVAFFPMHGQEVETLIGRADQAMYASKGAGGGRLAFCAT